MNEQTIEQQLRVLQASIDYLVTRLHSRSADEQLAKAGSQLDPSKRLSLHMEHFEISLGSYNDAKEEAAKGHNEGS